MKRIAWLLLALFCTALVQIQPVRGQSLKAKACDCCHGSGACGMPECCPPSAFASVALGSEESLRLARPAAQPAQAVRCEQADFYASFVEPAAFRPALSAAAGAAPARVPLFKAHCSFLI
jgi:hypothetical protein